MGSAGLLVAGNNGNLLRQSNASTKRQQTPQVGGYCSLFWYEKKQGIRLSKGMCEYERQRRG